MKNTIYIFFLFTFTNIGNSVIAQSYNSNGVLKYIQVTWFNDSTNKVITRAELFFNNSESMIKIGDSQKENKDSKLSVINKFSSENERINIFKSFNDKTIYSRENALTERMIVKDTLMPVNWIVGIEKRKIGNINCFRAEANLFGRYYIAWFAPSIPVSTGPWKLYGLPGLIIEAESKDGQVKFILESLANETNTLITIPVSTNKKLPVTKTEFLNQTKKNTENFRKMAMSDKKTTDKGEVKSINISIKGIEIFLNQ